MAIIVLNIIFINLLHIPLSPKGSISLKIHFTDTVPPLTLYSILTQYALSKFNFQTSTSICVASPSENITPLGRGASTPIRFSRFELAVSGNCSHIFEAYYQSQWTPIHFMIIIYAILPSLMTHVTCWYLEQPTKGGLEHYRTILLLHDTNWNSLTSHVRQRAKPPHLRCIFSFYFRLIWWHQQLRWLMSSELEMAWKNWSRPIPTYCHVSRVPWLIITGFGLDDYIYWRLILQSLTRAHNQWLTKTRYIPSWTTSVFSSIVTDLVRIYESVTSSTNHLPMTSHLRMHCLPTEVRIIVVSPGLILRPTVSWPVCLGIKHPSGAYDQIYITVRRLQAFWSGALSLMRGRVCHLQLLLVLATAVIFGFESHGTRDHILLSQIRNFPFRRLLRLTGLPWRYSTPPSHGIGPLNNSSSLHGRLYSLAVSMEDVCWMFVDTETRSILSWSLGIHLHRNMRYRVAS
jgi:hypothetical protein